MKVDASITACLVMTKKEIPNKTDPNIFYYRIGVVREEELGELRCTKEIFEQVEKGKTYDFGFVFNSQYNSLQVDRILRFHDIVPEPEPLAAAPAEPEPEKAAGSEPAEEKKKGSK